MSLGSKASASCKKVASFGATMFGKGFKSCKCETVARLATSRIKLLRNKREMQVKQMRRDVALLLKSGQEATARIRVEHVIREEKIMAANEIIELFCELIVVRLSVIAKQRGCPLDLKEGISSLIFAASRCSDIPELQQIRKIFEKKYGKDFVSAATELRPDCGVNRTLIEKLSVRAPTGEIKLKVMKDIAKEHQIEWDTAESEQELLKAPEELIDGPRVFVSASRMAVKPPTSYISEPNGTAKRSSSDKESQTMHFKDTASAAQAAAESAQKAVAAAQAAAYLANQTPEANSFSVSASGGNCTQFSVPQNPTVMKTSENFQEKLLDNLSTLPGSECGSQNSDRSKDMRSEEPDLNSLDANKIHRRYSGVHSDIKFDDSDGLDTDADEEIEMEAPPSRPPPPPPHRNQLKDYDTIGASNKGFSKHNSLSCVHPKLPDYDSLAARFEALKYRR